VKNANESQGSNNNNQQDSQVVENYNDFSQPQNTFHSSLPEPET
jgi:hypothetical protein